MAIKLKKDGTYTVLCKLCKSGDLNKIVSRGVKDYRQAYKDQESHYKSSHLDTPEERLLREIFEGGTDNG